MTEPSFLHLQNPSGIMLWPLDDIAMLRTERSGRIEATSSRGEAAHRPGPLADFAGPPLVEAVPGVFVHPRHARRRGGRLYLPGGWRIPFGGRLPRAAPPPPGPYVPELGVPLREVRYLRMEARGKYHWATDRGRLRAGAGDRRLAEDLGMLRLEGAYVNRLRVRGILTASVPRLLLDDGTRIPITSPRWHEVLAALEVPDLRFVERLAPGQEGLYRLGLRDWPRLVREAGKAELAEMFDGDERRLIANLIWETRELRAQGRPLNDGTSHRGYWYNPLRPVLQRAGVPLGAACAATAGRPLLSLGIPVIPPGGADSGPYGPKKYRLGPKADRYLRFLVILGQMAGDYRLLTYEELGFDEPRPDLRSRGQARPEVVLLVEKETVSHFAFELARRFGCSVMITGGQPDFLGTEYFVRALAPRGPVRLVAYVDHDPAGWIIAAAFRNQLERYGVETQSLCRLIHPRRFTEEELRDLSYPLPAGGKAPRTLIERWLEQGGGIDGKPLGIAADALRPLDRLVKAFQEETGLRPL